ncbi:MAG: apolipoprotein N-acyltransferase [Burkholderiaceae bacterium]|jgi:apolipoprotein N-acyltransferase|nr:apolipoprotein N-acyltransferase [Burkholderiaceae bacterium]
MARVDALAPSAARPERGGALAALLAGAGQALALADPWTGQAHGWLQMLTLAALVWLLLRGASFWRGGALGWLFALGWLAGAFWWLFISMHTYGGLLAPLALAAVLALAGFLALYYGVAAALFAWLLGRKGLGVAWRALAFAALWTLAELARGVLLTGFPWGAGGYAHVDGALAFLPRYVGVYGLGFVSAALAALLAQAGCVRWCHWRAMALTAAALLAAGASLWGARHCAINTCGAQAAADSAQRLTMAVTLLQGNIAQDIKFAPGLGVEQSLAWYGEQLRAARTPLVVAPETALPMLPDQLPAGYWQALRDHYSQGAQAALLGVPLGSFATGYTNSVAGFQPGQLTPYRYDKQHLVPFGEFVPRFFKWFVQMMRIPLGDFGRGALVQPSMHWQGQRLAPNICYEDLFGEELAARFANASQAPTAFVNVSNIAWFGDSVAMDQHLAISRMRALEFERPMLRATNTGATAIIDHRGAVTAQLPRLTRGALQGHFEGRTAITPYAWWAARLGLWPLAGWCTALLLGALAWRRREKPAPAA